MSEQRWRNRRPSDHLVKISKFKQTKKQQQQQQEQEKKEQVKHSLCGCNKVKNERKESRYGNIPYTKENEINQNRCQCEKNNNINSSNNNKTQINIEYEVKIIKLTINHHNKIANNRN